MCVSHRPCLVFVSIDGVYRSESKTQVVHFIVGILKVIGFVLKVTCYDDMCHLAKFISNREDSNEFMKFLTSLKQYIDRFHLKNHQNEECKTLYNADQDETMSGVNTEVCEQNRCLAQGFSVDRTTYESI